MLPGAEVFVQLDMRRVFLVLPAQLPQVTRRVPFFQRQTGRIVAFDFSHHLCVIRGTVRARVKLAMNHVEF